MDVPTEPAPGRNTRTGRGVVVVVLRVLAAAAALPLLAWAWQILDNIWGYNDSGTVTYLAYAAPLLLIGCALLAFAFRRRSR